MGLPREDRLGRYELLIELGRGGMAELFLGRLQGAGGFEKLVAIKRILPHLAQDPAFKDMFLNEGRIAARLMHPNVCQLFELEETGGDLFLVLEYLDGVSWDQLSPTLPRGPHGLWLTAGVLGQAAEGLHYAHTFRDVEGTPTPVIHRDVSPQNLFVTVDGVCKVLDFGVSKMMTDGPRTRTGVIKGKLPYMAPEQIRGEPLDGRADVFSLGVCAWEALTGQRLFDRSTDFQIWKAITEEPIAPIASLWPECPPAVEAVVQRSLARGREHRHASAREFAEAFQAAAGGAARLADIAQAVRERCGDRIAERQRQVATAVSSRKIDRDAAVTIPDGPQATDSGETMNLRQHSAKVQRPVVQDAGETRDLAPEPARSSGNGKKLVIVGVLAAAAAATIAVVVMKQSQSTPPAPAAAPQPVISAPAVPEVAPSAEPEPAPAPAPTEAPTTPKTAAKPGAKTPKAAAGSDDWVTDQDSDDTTTRIETGAEGLRKGAEELRKAAEQLKQLEQLRGLGGVTTGSGQ